MNYTKELNRQYDGEFVPNSKYINSLPDIQNTPSNEMYIDQVGMAGIVLPITLTSVNHPQTVLATIIGQVENPKSKRGINMSRIFRSLGVFMDEAFSPKRLTEIINSCRIASDRTECKFVFDFKYMMRQESLRSVDKNGNKNVSLTPVHVTFECWYDGTRFRYVEWVDYVYSSTCPCSTELSGHAGESRGVLALPHAQRSVARVGCEVDPDNPIMIEDIIAACQRAVPTWVQTFVKRVDEQAFAELCAAKGTVFVEDAVRMFAKSIESLGVTNYKVMCLHAESLHPHSAHAVIVKSDRLFNDSFSIADFKSMSELI